MVDELRPCGSAFVDRKLASHHTDLFYRVPLHSGDEAFLYLLFEHKFGAGAAEPYRARIQSADDATC